MFDKPLNFEALAEKMAAFAGKPILFFDLETTNADPDRARIIQMAGKLIFPDTAQYNGGGVHSFNFVINPKEEIDPAASAVHGFTNADLVLMPTFSEAAADIRALFEAGPIIAGFNLLAFDVPVLANEFGRLGELPPFTPKSEFIDFFLLYRKLYPNTLGAIFKRMFGYEFENAHDAAADIDATLAVGLNLLIESGKETVNEAAKIYADKPIADFSGKLNYNEAGEICYAFGKFAGVPVVREPDYARWMLTGNFPETTKAVLRSILK